MGDYKMKYIIGIALIGIAILVAIWINDNWG